MVAAIQGFAGIAPSQRSKTMYWVVGPYIDL